MNRRHWGLKQKKSLGQVFLRTDWPITKIVEKLHSWQAVRVLEIGPGAGVLTKALVQNKFRVTSVEKDDRFAEKLIELFPDEIETGHLEIVNKDILKFDLSQWINRSNEACAIVGNIPYNISTPIVMWFLPELNRVKGAHIMVQLEFGSRVAGVVGTKSYGSLSVYVQLRAKVEVDCKIDRTCFNPVPKVDSALVTFKTRSQIPAEKILQKIELLARSAFTQRRKQLRNSLSTFLTPDQEKSCPIDLSRRAETIHPDEFIDLANFLFQLG